MTQWTGANFCWLSETCNPAVCVSVCGSEMLLNVWENAKYVWQLKYSSRWIIPWGSASTRAKMGMCSSSQSLFTISLLFTSGTPLPWFTQTQWLSTQITKTALSERRQHSDQKQTEKYCDNDARGDLCAEVIIQKSLERRILLDDHDKFCRWYNIWKRTRMTAAMIDLQSWDKTWK